MSEYLAWVSYLVVVIRIHGGGSRLDCDPADLGVYGGDDGVGEIDEDEREREREAKRARKRRMEMCHTIPAQSQTEQTTNQSVDLIRNSKTCRSY